MPAEKCPGKGCFGARQSVRVRASGCPSGRFEKLLKLIRSESICFGCEQNDPKTRWKAASNLPNVKFHGNSKFGYALHFHFWSPPPPPQHSQRSPDYPEIQPLIFKILIFCSVFSPEHLDVLPPIAGKGETNCNGTVPPLGYAVVNCLRLARVVALGDSMSLTEVKKKIKFYK
jgi:hypothetical protein